MGERSRLPPEERMIQVPRLLIRACAALLAGTPRWRRRPLRSLIRLIYGLNSVFAGRHLYRYDDGFPRPSEAVKELDGLIGLARTAMRTGRSELVVDRLKTLEHTGCDSFNLLVFQTADAIDPERPQRVILERSTRDRLFEIARTEPEALASMAERAAASLMPLIDPGGQGGPRNSGPLVDRKTVFDLGIVFRDATGRYPRISTAIDGTRTGLFVEFVQTVFEALGEPIQGHRVARLLYGLDISEWKSLRRGKQQHGRANG